jgi:hypothetical protein
MLNHLHANARIGQFCSHVKSSNKVMELIFVAGGYVVCWCRTLLPNVVSVMRVLINSIVCVYLLPVDHPRVHFV